MAVERRVPAETFLAQVAPILETLMAFLVLLQLLRAFEGAWTKFTDEMWIGCPFLVDISHVAGQVGSREEFLFTKVTDHPLAVNLQIMLGQRLLAVELEVA
jgi:hypothetical protein